MYTIQNSVRVNTHRDGCLGKLLDPCRFSKLDYRTRRSLNLCLCFLTPVRIQTDTSSCKQGDARVIVTWAGWESKKAPGNTKAKNKTNWGGGQCRFKCVSNAENNDNYMDIEWKVLYLLRAVFLWRCILRGRTKDSILLHRQEGKHVRGNLCSR